jgi:hypothetical protein
MIDRFKLASPSSTVLSGISLTKTVLELMLSGYTLSKKIGDGRVREIIVLK